MTCVGGADCTRVPVPVPTATSVARVVGNPSSTGACIARSSGVVARTGWFRPPSMQDLTPMLTGVVDIAAGSAGGPYAMCAIAAEGLYCNDPSSTTLVRILSP